MISKVYSAGLTGAAGYEITVECDIQNRLGQFEMVGLPDAAVKEAKERVRAACVNSGFPFPDTSVVVNLAPADRKKEGTAYDLSVLMALLVSSGALRPDGMECRCFIGELSLSGEVRPANGMLCRVLAAKEAGRTEIFVPYENAEEAAVADGVQVFGVRTVRELVDHLTGIARLSPAVFSLDHFLQGATECAYDFADVRGQERAKRALEIAAAGGHNVLLIGPPGTGKSMLAGRLPGILPPLSFDEAVETTKIHSVAGLLPAHTSLVTTRPFRAPHHTATTVSLAGGGSASLRPGEVSLAHNGVLFLDELPEYAKSVTEILRQPLEDRTITITRMAGSVTYPCSVTLVCAMNPCKCGYYGHPTKPCTCTPASRATYLARVSGPLLDRIDMQIEVGSLSYEELSEREKGESSAEIRARVQRARAFALSRFTAGGEEISCNAQMSAPQIRKYCALTDETDAILHHAYDSMNLSARAHDRILRMARTIADLDASEQIKEPHLLEAISLRKLDRPDVE